MFRGTKSTPEIRFELLTWGAILVTAAIMHIVFQTTLPSMILFVPGLILLGSALFQDIQLGWRAGWLSYALAVITVATGLAGVINTVMGNVLQVNWLVIAAVVLGSIFIAKALYDPNPRPTEGP